MRSSSEKSLLASGDLNGAETEFLWVTRRWNADWRSVYRSFHYLAWTAERRGATSMRNHYRELLSIANPHYPTDAWPVLAASETGQFSSQPATASASSGRAK